MPRLRVQFGGTIGATGEWSNTLEFLLSGNVSNQATLQSIANGIRTALAADTTFKATYCTDTSLLTIKTLYYATGSSTATLVAEATGAGVVGTLAPLHAPQICSVASLRTGLPGRSARGRTYVPYRANGIAATGVLTGAAQAAVASYVSRLVTAVATSLSSQSLTASWVVWSTKTQTAAPITAILVGTQADTIRHRGRNANETYSSTAPPAVTLETDDQAVADAINALANAPITGPFNTSLGNTVEVLGVIAGAVVEGGE